MEMKGYRGVIEAIFSKGEMAVVSYKGGNGYIKGEISTNLVERQRFDPVTQERCLCYEFGITDVEGNTATVVIAKDQIEDILP